jgi:hypothetical protein
MEKENLEGHKICWTSPTGYKIELHVVVHKSKNGNYAYPFAEAYIDGKRSPGKLITREDVDGIVASLGRVEIDAVHKKQLDTLMNEAMTNCDVPEKVGIEKYAKEITEAITAYHNARMLHKAIGYLHNTFTPLDAIRLVKDHQSELDKILFHAFEKIPPIGPDDEFNFGDYPAWQNSGIRLTMLHKLIMEYVNNDFKFEKPDKIMDDAIFIAFCTPECVDAEKERLALREEFADFVEEYRTSYALP